MVKKAPTLSKKSRFSNSDLQYQNMVVSRPTAQKWKKNKGTFSSPTLKVLENKAPSVFSILGEQSRNQNFFILVLKIKIWPYLGLWAIIEKTEGTLSFWTFKVGENKVPLFFSFLARRPRYDHILVLKSSGAFLNT